MDMGNITFSGWQAGVSVGFPFYQKTTLEIENQRLRELVAQHEAFQRLVISLHPAFKEYEVGAVAA